MNVLRRQNSRPQQTFERWTLRTHESPRELARQSEAKRKQAPQSEANVCRHKCNPKKPRLLIAQDTQQCKEAQQKLGVAFSYLKRNNEEKHLPGCGNVNTLSYASDPSMHFLPKDTISPLAGVLPLMDCKHIPPVRYWMALPWAMPWVFRNLTTTR